jgi:NADH:ubiquinone oxidoreductase subunit 5 (subunit L)/multisubunit Na+/H+ antiporter MnhA subunit
MPGVVTPSSAQLLAGMGAAAIVFGSVVAVRQERLKLLVAYSTVAQIGYLFLMFPLAFDAGGNALEHGAALSAGVLQAVSHATAKAGMFMAAGLIYAALGHDRIADLAGAARAMPITLLAFVLSGVALMGVVPSGAYLAKKLLLDAADQSGQWWWTIVLQGGAVFTSGYVVLVLVNALRRPSAPISPVKRVARSSELAALTLSVASLLLAFAALGPVSGDLIKNPLALEELGATLLVLLGGAVLAFVLARSPMAGSAAAGESVRRLVLPVGTAFESADGFVRRWPSASIGLLSLAALFGWLLLGGAPH